MEEININELKNLNKYWIENVSDSEKNELEELSDKEIIDRYYTELEFGTAGLRGVMELGQNRMNVYTVSRATQAISEYILKRGMEKRGVAILYDTRNNSRKFAESTARVLLANGIKVYLFDRYRPVPILSFSTRDLNAFMGIMITASHNPKEYNGYKVFDETGLQIGKKVADEVMENINNINIFNGVKKISEEEFNSMIEKGNSLLEIVGEKQERKYLDILKTRILNDKEIEEAKKNIKVVYTPLHGTGDLVVNRILKELGYENIISVKEQQVIDGVFGTVKSPNPENVEAFEMALKLADEKGADVCIGTDPDCDRLGVLVRKNGKFKPLTGNQIGILMVEYILSQMKEKNILKNNYYVSTSIVSTNLTKKIAKEYGINYYETLTGFKNICSASTDENEEFLFGFEESFRISIWKSCKRQRRCCSINVNA